MIFGIEEFNALTRGVVKIENQRGAYQFYRFNEEEMEFYAPTVHLKKSYATSGVEICALTDASAVSISGSVRPGSSRSYFSFDVLVNGELAGEIKNFEHCDMIPNYTAKPFDMGEFSGRVELPEGKKEVRIVFPWSVAPDISRFELEGASFVEPIPSERKMLIYGDSITQGYDAENPSRSYASQIARALNADAINKGIGGEIFCPALAAIKNNNAPDIITVAYGTNDYSKCKPSVLEKNARGFYKALSENYPNARIFAITPIWRGTLDTQEKLEGFLFVSRIIQTIADEHSNIIHIEGIDLLEHSTDLFADEWLHPRNIGFDQYADGLIGKIKSLL